MAPARLDPNTAGDGLAEAELLVALARFLDLVRSEAPFAADNVAAALAGLRELVAHEGPWEERDRWVLALLGMYGGMGSVNDFPWTKAGQAAKEALYDALIAARRRYWRLAGNPCHDPQSFPPLVLDARVRLREGAVYNLDRTGRPFRVTATLSRRRWTVRSAPGVDISGMPIYTLRSGNRYVVARQDAIATVPDPRQTPSS